MLPPVVSRSAMTRRNSVFRSAHFVLSRIARRIVSHYASVYSDRRLARFLVGPSRRCCSDGSTLCGSVYHRGIFMRHCKSVQKYFSINLINFEIYWKPKTLTVLRGIQFRIKHDFPIYYRAFQPLTPHTQ